MILVPVLDVSVRMAPVSRLSGVRCDDSEMIVDEDN